MATFTGLAGLALGALAFLAGALAGAFFFATGGFFAGLAFADAGFLAGAAFLEAAALAFFILSCGSISGLADGCISAWSGRTQRIWVHFDEG